MAEPWQALQRMPGQNVAAVKQFLNHGHHLHQRRSLELLISTLAGSRLSIQPHFTRNVLRSATLTVAYIKNWLTRNQESITASTIRRILALADYKHPLWQYRLDQHSKKQQYIEVAERLETELQGLELRKRLEPANSELDAQLAQTRETLKRVRLVVRLMQPFVQGSLHPDAPLQAHSEASDPGNGEGLQLRGLLIRIAGPRKGNRAMVWQRSVGSVSINSVEHVVAEDAKVPLPSKLGIFGLYLRIVYQRTAQQPLNSTKAPSSLRLFNGTHYYNPFQ